MKPPANAAPTRTSGRSSGEPAPTGALSRTALPGGCVKVLSEAPGTVAGSGPAVVRRRSAAAERDRN